MKEIAILFILSLIMSCCDKDTFNESNQLPLETKTGANTAGCYINGELLIPKNGTQAIGGSPSYGLTTGAGNNFHPPTIGGDYKFIRIANLRDSGGDDVYIHFNNMTMGTGDYNIGQSNGEYYMDGPNNPQIIVHTFDGVNLGKTYYSGANAGTITVTRFDYPNGIYSAVFNCTLYNKDNPSEIIQVTNGRFDINVATLNH